MTDITFTRFASPFGADPLPNMRDGILADTHPLTSHVAIPPAYHWPNNVDVVSLLLAVGPFGPLEAFARDEFALLGAEAFPGAAAVAAAGARPARPAAARADAAAAAPAGDGVAAPPLPPPAEAVVLRVRARALILAAVRLGAAAVWHLALADLSVGELAPSIFAVHGAGGTATVRHAGGAPRGDELFAPLTAEELEAAAVFFRAGAGLVGPIAKSLADTAHHYLTGTSSAKRHAAVLRQVGMLAPKVGVVPACVAAVLGRAGTELEWLDLVCHKALHPVSSALFQAVAIDVAVPPRYVAMGLGAAAVGLPANGGEAAGVGAVVALLSAIEPLLATASGSLAGLREDFEAARAAVAAATTANDRRTAAHDAQELLANEAPTVAFAIGLLGASVQAAGGTSTLLTAFSLRRIRDENLGQSAAGGEFFKARGKAVKRMGAYALAPWRPSAAVNPVRPAMDPNMAPHA